MAMSHPKFKPHTGISTLERIKTETDFCSPMLVNHSCQLNVLY